MPSQPSKELVTVPNPNPERDYTVEVVTPEFTCLCPMTGQPDFAEITLRYIPDQLLVELKSLKLYFWSFRDEGAFHEAVTNRILDDVIGAIAPREASVTGKFNVRGGLYATITAKYVNPDRA